MRLHTKKATPMTKKYMDDVANTSCVCVFFRWHPMDNDVDVDGDGVADDEDNSVMAQQTTTLTKMATATVGQATTLATTAMARRMTMMT